eukprot:351208-Chlamydomonas_euryale.AAC.3
MSNIRELVDITARTLYGDTTDLTKSVGDLRAQMFNGHRRGALDAKSSMKMARMIALRELRNVVEDKLSPIVESLHDEIEEKDASEKRTRIKDECCQRKREELHEENKRMKREESNVSTSCPVCLKSVGLEPRTTEVLEHNFVWAGRLCQSRDPATRSPAPCRSRP